MMVNNQERLENNPHLDCIVENWGYNPDLDLNYKGCLDYNLGLKASRMAMLASKTVMSDCSLER